MGKRAPKARRPPSLRSGRSLRSLGHLAFGGSNNSCDATTKRNANFVYFVISLSFRFYALVLLLKVSKTVRDPGRVESWLPGIGSGPRPGPGLSERFLNFGCGSGCLSRGCLFSASEVQPLSHFPSLENVRLSNNFFSRSRLKT